MDASIQTALYGAFAATHVIAAAFFLRFSRRTQAPFFAIFATSFLLLAVSYALLCLSAVSEFEPKIVYLIRLCAFVLLIAGIIWTNLREKSQH